MLSQKDVGPEERNWSDVTPLAVATAIEGLLGLLFLLAVVLCHSIRVSGILRDFSNALTLACSTPYGRPSAVAMIRTQSVSCWTRIPNLRAQKFGSLFRSIGTAKTIACCTGSWK